MWSIPNVISLTRLVAILPLTWVMAVSGHSGWVGILILLGLISDILDGYLARRLNQVTGLGARLDSLADNLLVPSALVWLIMLCGEVTEPENLILMTVAAAVYLSMLAVGLIRFRMFAGLHLYSGKSVGMFGTLFLLDAFLFGFHVLPFYIALTVFTLANLEGLLIFSTFAEVDEHIGSFLRRRSWRAERTGTLPGKSRTS